MHILKCILFFLIFFSSTSLFSDYSSIVKKYSQTTAVLIQDQNGNDVFSYRKNDLLKPASIQKLITTNFVLQKYDSYKRFRTNFYYKDNILTISTNANPSLVMEDIWIIVNELKARGVSYISKIVYDFNGFKYFQPRSGQRSYQASVHPFSLNYNSVSFIICPESGSFSVKTKPDNLGIYIDNKLKKSNKNSFSLNENEDSTYTLAGNYNSKSCSEVNRSVKDPLGYLQKVIVNYFNLIDVPVQNQTYSKGQKSGDLIYSFASKPLDLILRDLNHYSSNFIADMLLLSLSRSENLSLNSVLNKMQTSISLNNEGFKTLDGSGLSHDNRLSVNIVVKTIRNLLNNKKISLESYLPISEKTGTLSKRNYNNNFFRAKTGSLTGVQSLAGVLYKNGQRYPFAIIQNNVKSKSSALRFEKEIINYFNNN